MPQAPLCMEDGVSAPAFIRAERGCGKGVCAVGSKTAAAGVSTA